MTHAEFIAYLKAQVAQHGSQRKYAACIGTSAVHLGKILKSVSRPSDKLLARMGVKRTLVASYELLSNPAPRVALKP